MFVSSNLKNNFVHPTKPSSRFVKTIILDGESGCFNQIREEDFVRWVNKIGLRFMGYILGLSIVLIKLIKLSASF